ncbi:hypothetical protein [Saccharolobus shibatae]|uniref:Uncharacterized protein n=2 Tax=Saccharolobus shibatae TaxID=2286 RepID=A0A8F5BQ89_SACSH|nr:hypothetical protein [Saccharolobus shibatae]QXJ29480.1 Uncharacterized protein J5U23_02349 [Saccharolobus shibatae B12]QXJ32714.1 Uncharacterized protein J5U21_02365 [Saccharolobus shibatae]
MVFSFIDFNTHYGIKLYNYLEEPKLREDKIEINRIVLNPIYKYSCDCCVDGFYQQYLWGKKDYILRLGIYNPRCRVPPQVELLRQVERGIIGIVLSPKHHNFSLLHPSLSFVYELINRKGLFLVLYDPSLDELKWLLDKYTFPVVLINSKHVINDERVYYVVNHTSTIIDPRSSIYGSDAPYNSLNLIQSAKLFINNHGYDEGVAYKNAIGLLKRVNVDFQ